MRELFYSLLLLFICSIGNSQIAHDEFDKQFALQVKQIDEFIERFNFDTVGQNVLNEYLDRNNISNSDTFDRSFFLKTIFNHEEDFNNADVSTFLSNVDNSTQPIYISFYDKDWYAKLDCEFFFLGKPTLVSLTLFNQVKENQISKWVICAVKSELFSFPETSDSTKILNPMSHAVNFMTIDKALMDKRNSKNYFKRDFSPDALSQFYFLIQNNILVFQRINHISYHFLQVPDWYFKVEQFNRQTYNSGWLISQIRKMSIEEKIKYKKEVLNIIN